MERFVRTPAGVQCLNDQEIDEFLGEINPRHLDEYIKYSDLEQKLDEAYDEIFQQRGSRHVIEHDCNRYTRHAVLQRMLGPHEERIPRIKLVEIIRQWKIPSFQQLQKQEEKQKDYFSHRPCWPRMRAFWSVRGPEVLFVGLVIAMQVAFGVWQAAKYQNSPDAAAFGWGGTVGKACAGALYPTFFFLILSTSRFFSTLLRRFRHFSRFFSLDFSQKFHIRMSCAALALATVHGLAHLAGTFTHGSAPSNKPAVLRVVGSHKLGGNFLYIDFIRSVPGFTGITALSLFYILALLSLPRMRRWSYNIFQLGHLLVYPIIGLMMAHGTEALLQKPMFGYFLAFPTFLLLLERMSRIIHGFFLIKATLKILDSQTVEMTAVIPTARPWDYSAGQYIFVQVPKISSWQWHPFTISFCRNKTIKLHIKTDGDWTTKLRNLGTEIEVGIHGPFGAPAQRFLEYRNFIVIGAGIGITPFAAILADLQHKADLDFGNPGCRDVSSRGSNPYVPSDQRAAGAPDGSRLHCAKNNGRRTDFHWIVRDGNYLMWLSDLLNKVSASQKFHHEHGGQSSLDIRINTYITAKSNRIASYVYSWLLEMGRTAESPASPLTGLLNDTYFGRPDLDRILDEHYKDMRQANKQACEGTSLSKAHTNSGSYKVGVFYCGAAALGEMLADKCSQLTIRGREDGSKIEYHCVIEVFT